MTKSTKTLLICGGIGTAVIIAVIYFWSDIKIQCAKLFGGNVEGAQASKVNAKGIARSGKSKSKQTPAAGSSLYANTDGLQVWNKPSNGVDSSVVATYSKDAYVGIYISQTSPSLASQARGTWYQVNFATTIRHGATQSGYVYSELVSN